MADLHEHRYRLECEIRDKGEPLEHEKRIDDPKSFLTASFSIIGKKAEESLINLLKGLADGDPENHRARAMERYIEDSIKAAEGKETSKLNKEPVLVVQRKTEMKSSFIIKVYRTE